MNKQGAKTKQKPWYQVGYDEARDGLNCDPPWSPGHKAYANYCNGYSDGQRSLKGGGK
jgi:hypothetical protein